MKFEEHLHIRLLDSTTYSFWGNHRPQGQNRPKGQIFLNPQFSSDWLKFEKDLHIRSMNWTTNYFWGQHGPKGLQDCTCRLYNYRTVQHRPVDQKVYRTQCRTVPIWSFIWFELNLFQSHFKFNWIIIIKERHGSGSGVESKQVASKRDVLVPGLKKLMTSSHVIWQQ